MHEAAENKPNASFLGLDFFDYWLESKWWPQAATPLEHFKSFSSVQLFGRKNGSAYLQEQVQSSEIQVNINVFLQILVKCPGNGTADLSLPNFLLAMLVAAPCLRCFKGRAAIHHLEPAGFIRFGPCYFLRFSWYHLVSCSTCWHKNVLSTFRRAMVLFPTFLLKTDLQSDLKGKEKGNSRKGLQFSGNKCQMLFPLHFKPTFEFSNLKLLIFQCISI